MPQMLSPFSPGAAGAEVVPGLATVGGGEVGAGAAMSCARAVGAKTITSAPDRQHQRPRRVPQIPTIVFMNSPVCVTAETNLERDENKTADHCKLTFVHK